MKKIFAFMLVLTILLSLAACGKRGSEQTPSGTDGTSNASQEGGGETSSEAISLPPISDMARISTGRGGSDYVTVIQKDGTVLCDYREDGETTKEKEKNNNALKNIAAVLGERYFLSDDGRFIIADGTAKGETAFSGIIGGTPAAFHIIGIKPDGTVVIKRAQADAESYSQLEGIEEWKDIVAVAGGYNAAVGLRKDGTVATAGSNKFGQLDVADWTGIKQLVVFDTYADLKKNAAIAYTLGVTTEGRVLIAGNTNYTAEINALTEVEQIAVISTGYAALKKDGTVVVGSSLGDYASVKSWTDITAIAFGNDVLMGVKRDGSVLFAKNYADREDKWPCTLDWKIK